MKATRLSDGSFGAGLTSAVSLVLTLTCLTTWTTPSYGLRQTGLEESSQREALEDRLRREASPRHTPTAASLAIPRADSGKAPHPGLGQAGPEEGRPRLRPEEVSILVVGPSKMRDPVVQAIQEILKGSPIDLGRQIHEADTKQGALEWTNSQLVFTAWDLGDGSGAGDGVRREFRNSNSPAVVYLVGKPAPDRFDQSNRERMFGEGRFINLLGRFEPPIQDAISLHILQRLPSPHLPEEGTQGGQAGLEEPSRRDFLKAGVAATVGAPGLLFGQATAQEIRRQVIKGAKVLLEPQKITVTNLPKEITQNVKAALVFIENDNHPTAPEPGVLYVQPKDPDKEWHFEVQGNAVTVTTRRTDHRTFRADHVWIFLLKDGQAVERFRSRLKEIPVHKVSAEPDSFVVQTKNRPELATLLADKKFAREVDLIVLAIDGKKQAVRLLAPQSGLEEAQGARSTRPLFDLEQAVVFLSFDPASGVALTQAGLEALHPVVLVADTPTTAWWMIREFDIDPSRILGLLWAGLEETDYLALGVRALAAVDPTLSGWMEEVKRVVFQRLGPGVPIIPVYDRMSLAAGLESVGASKGMIERVLQLHAGAEEALAGAV